MRRATAMAGTIGARTTSRSKARVAAIAAFALAVPVAAQTEGAARASNAADAMRWLQHSEPAAADRRRIGELIAQLVDPRFAAREAAENALLEYGAAARQQLDAALAAADLLELEFRVRRLLLACRDLDVEQHARAMLSALERERPAGAFAALLGALPRIATEPLAADLTRVLAALAAPDDAAALGACATSASPLLQRIALGVLRRRGDLATGVGVDALLNGRDATVRLEAAWLFADRGDRRALAAFVDLVADGDAVVAARAHRLLVELTGRTSPRPVTGRAKGRLELAADWRAWLRDHGPTAPLHLPLRGDPRRSPVRGFALAVTGTGIVFCDRSGRVERQLQCSPYDVQVTDGEVVVTERDQSRVRVLTPAGHELRQVAGLSSPTDADLLDNGNLLVLEGGAGAVVEYDSAGKVVWRQAGLSNPFDAERLPDGNTLVADSGNNRLVEFAPDGTVVWEKRDLAFPNGVVRLDDGRTIYTTYTTGHVVMLDARGDVVWQVLVPGGTVYSPEVAGDRIYVGDTAGKQVLVFDLGGRRLERITVPQTFCDIGYVR